MCACVLYVHVHAHVCVCVCVCAGAATQCCHRLALEARWLASEIFFLLLNKLFDVFLDSSIELLSVLEVKLVRHLICVDGWIGICQQAAK